MALGSHPLTNDVRIDIVVVSGVFYDEVWAVVEVGPVSVASVIDAAYVDAFDGVNTTFGERCCC